METISVKEYLARNQHCRTLPQLAKDLGLRALRGPDWSDTETMVKVDAKGCICTPKAAEPAKKTREYPPQKAKAEPFKKSADPVTPDPSPPK